MSVDRGISPVLRIARLAVLECKGNSFELLHSETLRALLWSLPLIA